MSAATPLTRGESLRGGAVGIAPIALAALPFGLITGLATVEVGLGLREAIGLSTIVFAGAAQLAVIELLGAQAPVWVAVLTVAVINLRMAMYSASLAPYLAAEPLHRRLGGAYLLSDQAYAVSITRFVGESDTRADRWWFYLGAAVPLWAVFQPATIVGALVGDVVPEGVPLSFAVPLAFLALVVPAITDRPTLAAALTAATVATVGVGWPANLGMPVGALVGVLVGWALARRRADRRRPWGP